MRLIDRIFKMEEINGGKICPTYLFRWTILKTRWFDLYLHHFVGDDWSRDLHDHPKRFISFGFFGSYIEETPTGEKKYRAPFIRTFPADHIHRLRLEPGRTAWTFVIALRPTRRWGFWHLGKWIHWVDYVDSDNAEMMKSCAD